MTSTTAGSGPTGRDAVVDALIESATALFAERGLDDVSVREIAAAAGVNHALVFRHFGTKAGLLRAVLAHQRRQFSDAAEMDRPRSQISAKLGLYTVILARVLLDGDADLLEEVEEHPVSDWLHRQAKDAQLTDERASQLAATVLALELGWRLFLPAFAPGTGIDMSRADDLLDDSTSAVIDALWEKWAE